jgi:hypothetical protein
MARQLRMESDAGVYHVLNRGNYRSETNKRGQALCVCFTLERVLHPSLPHHICRDKLTKGGLGSSGPIVDHMHKA